MQNKSSSPFNGLQTITFPFSLLPTPLSNLISYYFPPCSMHIPASVASLLFLKYTWLASVVGTSFHKQFPLSGMFFIPYHMAHSPQPLQVFVQMTPFK